VKDAAKTLGKQALWSLANVKATYHDVGKYYLVLTEKNLYYIAFDKHDEVAVKEVFPLSALRNVVVRKVSSKDMMINKDGMGSDVLQFEIDGDKVVFVYKPQNQQFPNLTIKEFQKALTDNYHAFLYIETRFTKKLAELAGGIQE
jgi:hypothetical protein